MRVDNLEVGFEGWNGAHWRVIVPYRFQIAKLPRIVLRLTQSALYHLTSLRQSVRHKFLARVRLAQLSHKTVHGLSVFFFGPLLS